MQMNTRLQFSFRLSIPLNSPTCRQMLQVKELYLHAPVAAACALQGSASSRRPAELLDAGGGARGLDEAVSTLSSEGSARRLVKPRRTEAAASGTARAWPIGGVLGACGWSYRLRKIELCWKRLLAFRIGLPALQHVTPLVEGLQGALPFSVNIVSLGHFGHAFSSLSDSNPTEAMSGKRRRGVRREGTW